jgi:hypothetical protein
MPGHVIQVAMSANIEDLQKNNKIKMSMEPKTCFGHNMSISTQNQMKF